MTYFVHDKRHFSPETCIIRKEFVYKTVHNISPLEIWFVASQMEAFQKNQRKK